MVTEDKAADTEIAQCATQGLGWQIASDCSPVDYYRMGKHQEEVLLKSKRCGCTYLNI